MKLKIYREAIVIILLGIMLISCDKPNKRVGLSDDGNKYSNDIIKNIENYNEIGKNGYKNIYVGSKFDSNFLKKNTEIVDECFNAIEKNGDEDTYYQIESGVVSLIYTSDINVKSYTGVKIGDRLEDVYSKHNNETAAVLDNPYGEPKKNIIVTYWYSPKKDMGIRYDVDDGLVSGISIGDSSLVFLEGCL